MPQVYYYFPSYFKLYSARSSAYTIHGAFGFDYISVKTAAEQMAKLSILSGFSLPNAFEKAKLNDLLPL